MRTHNKLHSDLYIDFDKTENLFGAISEKIPKMFCFFEIFSLKWYGSYI